MADLTEDQWVAQMQEAQARTLGGPLPPAPTTPPLTPETAFPVSPEEQRKKLQTEAATPEEKEWMAKMEKDMTAAGQGSALMPPLPYRALSNRAIAAGIGTNGVSAAARFNMGLALGSVTQPQQQLEVVRRAIENDIGQNVEVRIGPLNELEWRRRGEQSWDLVNGAGFSSMLRDIAGSTPELGVAGSGVLAGIGAQTLGGMYGPITGTVANTGATGVAEAVAEYVRLSEARRQGLIDWDEERIAQSALQRGGLASGGTAAAAVGLNIFRRVRAFLSGTPTNAVNAFMYDQSGRARPGSGVGSSIEGGLIPAQELQDRVRSLAGQDFPMTSGQVAAMPSVVGTRAGQEVSRETLPPGAGEALLAQEAARRMDEAGAPVRNILAQQAATLDAADFATFGANDATALTRAGRAIQGAMNTILFRRNERAANAVGQRRALAGEAGDNVEMMSQTHAVDAASNMDITRRALTGARQEILDSFGPAYDRIQNQTGVEVQLGPFRDSAREVLRRWGQGVLDTISIRGQGNVVDEARRAGEEVVGVINGVRILMDRPATLRQVMQTIEDINEQLRRPTIENLPRADATLRVLRDGLMEAVERSAGPETVAQIRAVQQAYAMSVEQFDTGIVGQILARDRFDNFTMSGDNATQLLLRDPSATRAFVNALFTRQEINDAGERIVTSLPEGHAALTTAQNAVLSTIVRQFRDYQTREWNMPALRTFLQENQEALQMLFVRGPQFARAANPTLDTFGPRAFPLSELNEVRLWSNAADRMQTQQDAARKLFDERFGVFTHDPSVMVQTLLTEGRVTDLNLARRMVQRVYGPEGVARFNSGLASQARNLMVGGDGVLTPQRIDEFLGNESGRTVVRMLGPEFGRNLTTLRDMLRVMELRGTGSAVDIARQFGHSVPGLRGMLRFLRVIAPPLSPRGRALTATVGLANEATQRQIGQLLADPERLSMFIRQAERIRDPLAQGTRIQLTRMGFGHIPQFWDMANRVYGITADNLTEEEPVPGSAAPPGGY